MEIAGVVCCWGFFVYYNEEYSLFASPNGYRFFETIIGSLTKAKIRIEDLTLGEFHYSDLDNLYNLSDVPMLGIIQGLSCACPVYQQALGGLKCLKIILPATLEAGPVLRLDFCELSAFI